MNDATDVSLEADRLEELLEAPVATPPVVMIEYRNRGVPWWVLGTILVLVPTVVGAIAYYQYSVVERYRAEAAKAEYIQKVQAVEQAAATKHAASTATPVSILADTADPSVLQVAGPAEAGGTAKGGAGPSAGSSTKVANVELGAAAAGSSSTAVDEPSRPRVRSITRSPFDTSDEESPASNGAGGDAVAGAAGTATKKGPGESSGAKLAAAPKDARAGEKAGTSTIANVGPPAEGSPAAQSSDAAVAKADGGRDGGVRAPAVEPLPNAEEFLNQTTEEAAKKERELVEQDRANAERSRVATKEERVKFHEELREILAVHGKHAGEEIDQLVRRSQKLHDPRTFTRAKNVWGQLRLSQQAKVDQIRALDICEAAILNFISDKLHVRMRSPGGPRDANEVRVRAAQILLSYKLSGEKDSPESTAAPSKDLKARGAGGAGPQ
jgi:hypothetical protein